MKRFPYIIAMVALALVAAACSGEEEPEETTTTTLPPTTTTVAETTTTVTTTTIVESAPSLLNGMPVEEENEDLLDRRVVAVKIDNHPDARPQSGLQEAEAVIEIIVEAGLTRFIALYQTTESEYVGPIRSVRPTDPGLLRPLGATFQFSGGQPWIQSLIAAEGVPSLNENAPSTWRIARGGRAYERTLYGSTAAIREVADEQEYPNEAPPGPWFTFGEPTETDEPATVVTLSWSRNWPDVNWDWDGEQYVRSNGDVLHAWSDENGDGEQIAVDTLLVLVADQYNACPGAGQGGSCVPAEVTTGTGTALLFYDGKVVEGVWHRESSEDFFTLTLAPNGDAEDGEDADIEGDVVEEDVAEEDVAEGDLDENDAVADALIEGEEMVLPPGRLWVSVFPSDRDIVWE